MPVRKRAHGLLAGALPEVAVHGAGREAALLELVGHLLRGALGAGEDHGQAATTGLQDAGQHLDLVHRVRAVDELVDVFRRRRVAVGLGPDLHRLVHELPGQTRRWVPGIVAENSMV